MLYSKTLTAGLQHFGAAALLYGVYRVVDFNSLWLFPKKSLARYQRHQKAFAFITGASAGIGRGTAEELAARGFNVIILGHKSEELELVRNSIREHSPHADVHIVVLDVITGTNAEIEKVFNDVKDLPITTLVNNVGGVPVAHPAIRDFAAQTADDLDRTINLNARFMAPLSRLTLPMLARNGASLMMNLSSIGHMGMPGVVPYSGTKAFDAALSRGIARECKANGLPVDVVAIL